MTDPYATQDRMALSREETDTLARYNAEVYRGILHTPEWVAKMAVLQARFDRTHR